MRSVADELFRSLPCPVLTERGARVLRRWYWLDPAKTKLLPFDPLLFSAARSFLKARISLFRVPPVALR